MANAQNPTKTNLETIKLKANKLPQPSQGTSIGIFPIYGIVCISLEIFSLTEHSKNKNLLLKSLRKSVET